MPRRAPVTGVAPGPGVPVPPRVRVEHPRELSGRSPAPIAPAGEPCLGAADEALAPRVTERHAVKAARDRREIGPASRDMGPDHVGHPPPVGDTAPRSRLPRSSRGGLGGVSAGPSDLSPASSHGVADGASQRPSFPRMAEIPAARVGRSTKDFHIARAPRLIRAVLRMGVMSRWGDCACFIHG